VMPKGVEHPWDQTIPVSPGKVPTSVMPKGVEHGPTVVSTTRKSNVPGKRDIQDNTGRTASWSRNSRARTPDGD
jgi:hypothetical protein